MTKTSAVLLSVLATVAFLPACYEYWQWNHSANYESDVIRAFASNRNTALTRYRDSWKDAPVVEEQMVVAAELMEADPSNYERYYRYVTNGLKSNNERVVTAATRAMRSTKGDSSLDLLFGLYVSNDPAISHAAMDSIRYRYGAATQSFGPQSEALTIKTRAAKANLPLEQ